jgi:CRP/FNR family transcriptional regulator
MTTPLVEEASPPAGEVSLAQAELFRRLPPERIERLRSVLRERRLARGRTLFREGRPAELLWVLQSGAVRLIKASPNGRITTLETIGPGEMFGALDAGEVYPASAEAICEGRAWCIPRRVFQGLLAERPDLGLEILGVVSRRLREAHERLRSFAHDAVPIRLARALLATARDGDARVTRRALAEAAGTTVETAIRVLRRFEREGLVAGEIGLIHVLDPAGLRRIAGLAEPGERGVSPSD